jgi:hypothetical protein
MHKKINACPCAALGQTDISGKTLAGRRKEDTLSTGKIRVI